MTSPTPVAPAMVQPLQPAPPPYIKTNHVLHLLLTLFTCGFWAMIWPIVYFINERDNAAKRHRHEYDLAMYQYQLWHYNQQRQ